MMVVISVLIMSALYHILYRIWPARSVYKVPVTPHQSFTGRAVVDTRDYQISYKDPYPQAYCLPLAYLKRHAGELPDLPLLLVSTNEIEKNMAAKVLRKKGFTVEGYALAGECEECPKVPCMAGS
ncbi:hypothetical protein GLW04_07185 [Halobacillus litoralis]|uniref:Sulfurtransferase n=1 Tax=Halobacillus litoralis TaxID=45668 RepID=A0A845DR64_9BACI|nr:hypothetical protein [Halobacillus litoralis]MYL19668.1 hypothetical protein [Halobacillus litoralis]MYL37064.1 hypothetical protein [Halobacillus litoralis]